MSRCCPRRVGVHLVETHAAESRGLSILRGHAAVKRAQHPKIDHEVAHHWVDATLAACLNRVNRRDLVRQLAFTVVVGVLLAIGLRSAVRTYVVEGGSMLPGLHPGDRLLVNQLAYRWSAPARGDVVVFRFPRPGSQKDLVKRIIGLPGDTVLIQPGLVAVNGRRIAEPYVQNAAGYTYGPRRVPAGEYFVLGDNREIGGREISYDSHQWGFLPASDVYGRVMLVYWPPGDTRLFGL